MLHFLAFGPSDLAIAFDTRTYLKSNNKGFKKENLALSVE